MEHWKRTKVNIGQATFGAGIQSLTPLQLGLFRINAQEIRTHFCKGEKEKLLY